MFSSANDIVPFSHARNRLSELIDEVREGAEKVITRNGEGCAALIDTRRLDYYHRLEREHIHLLLLEDADRGLQDVTAGRTHDARTGLAVLQARRQHNGKTP